MTNLLTNYRTLGKILPSNRLLGKILNKGGTAHGSTE